mgnify:CR=1 FL=1
MPTCARPSAVPGSDWEKGAFIQLLWAGGYHGSVRGGDSPGDALKTERHMHEEIYYILAGSGSTEIVAPDGKAQRFWVAKRRSVWDSIERASSAD